MSAIALTPAEIRSEAWRRGRLGYLLHSGQHQIENAFQVTKGQLFVSNVSRQFGKSYWAVTKAISLALAKPKQRIKYATAYQTDLIEFIIPTFDTVLQDCPPRLRPKWRVQGSKWIFSNGSEIKLVGLDKSPNSLRGNVIDLIFIDECGFVGDLKYIYESIIVPATLHRPNCKIVMISTPPSTPAHPFVDFIQKAEAEGGYIKLDIYQNPRITDADITRMSQELGGKDSTAFRRECLCELITDTDAQIIPEWKDEYIVETPKSDLYVFWDKYISMDMGRVDKTALLFAHYDFKRAKLVIEDELEMAGPKWTTLTLKKDLLEKQKELWGELKIYRRIADCNNPHLIADLSYLHAIPFIETTKESREAMVNELRLMVGNGQIEINPRCKMLIGCLKYGVWDAKRKDFARSKLFGHYDHLAALVYLVRNLDKHHNPVPRHHGWDLRNSIIHDRGYNSENSKFLNKLFPFKPKRPPTY